MELTVLARFPKLMLERAEAAGLDHHALEDAAGLIETDLADPDARIPTSKLRALWKEIIQLVPDPLFGLKFGSSLRTRDLGLVGYIIAASHTLGDAFESMARYGRILADDIQVTLRHDTDTVDIEISAPLELAALRHPVVSRLTCLLSIAREVTESDLHPLSVRLPQAMPSDPASYREFFQTGVQFEAGVAALTFAARDLERPIPSADRALSNYLEDYARGILKSLPARDSLLSRIWRILMARLPAGDPGIEAVADTLGVNVRTVQRRLKENGTTYRQLRDAFRRTTARELLKNQRTPIKEIAFLLGYQDLGAFLPGISALGTLFTGGIPDQARLGLNPSGWWFRVPKICRVPPRTESAPPGHAVWAMNTEQTVAIVVAQALDRSHLHELLVAEGFAVESFSRPEEFVDAVGSTNSQYCLVVDLDHFGGDSHREALLNFASRWCREFPTLAIASDPSRLPQNPLLPTISKAAGESHLLYLLYGALSEPATTTNQLST